MKRRPKRRLRAHPVLWLLVCLNVAAALVASRLTAMRHIEVFGAKPYDQPRIAAILANMRGVPRARLNSERIESDVMQEPSVREAKLAANWFGQGSLSVLYRKPVAKLAGLSTLALDEQGVVYSAPDLPAGLTEIQFPGGAPPTLVGLAGDWPAGYLAKLAGDVRTLGATGNVSIQVDADGAICLNVGAGRVKLGSCDILDHKLEVLRQRLRANPNELSQIEELVLTNPDRPAIVKKKQVSRQ